MKNLGSALNEEEEEEELGGLPIPPLDDDDAFAPYTPTTFDLLHFFDEFDDNGDPRELIQTRHIRGKDIKILQKVLKGEESTVSLERKFEYTKRKFRESYQIIEKEKKRRKIQVIDFQPMAMEVASRKMVRPKHKK